MLIFNILILVSYYFFWRELMRRRLDIQDLKEICIDYLSSDEEQKDWYFSMARRNAQTINVRFDESDNRRAVIELLGARLMKIKMAIEIGQSCVGIIMVHTVSQIFKNL